MRDPRSGLAILGAGRNDFSVRQGKGANEPEAGLVARPADLHGDGLSDAGFEISLSDIADPEEAGRGALTLPALNRATGAFYFDREVGVWVAPIDSSETACEGDAVVEIEDRSHVVMCLNLTDQQGGEKEWQKPQEPDSRSQGIPPE